MQQVQECLDFPIDTPSDNDLMRRFKEEEDKINQAFRDMGPSLSPVSTKTTKNRRKRERKAARNARRITAKA